MKLTPVEQIRKGLWFVRRITGEQDLGRSSWAIGMIQGEFPFLHGRVVVYSEDIRGLDMDRILRGSHEITNPNEWEFAEKIEFPEEEIE